MSPMRICRTFLVLLSAVACGGITSLGNVRDTDGGEGGTSGALGGDATGSAPDAGPRCPVVHAKPVPNPTAEEIERAALIHDYCATQARDGCLNRAELEACSTEDRIVACEQLTYGDYLRTVGPLCEAAWRALIACGASETYTVAPHPHTGCVDADIHGAPAGPCVAERLAFSECQSEHGSGRQVTGARTTCGFGFGLVGECEIGCWLGEDFFSAHCGAPPGLPLTCYCSVNGNELSDTNWSVFEVFQAAECREAAQGLADGAWCTNRLDCCFEFDDSGEHYCECGSSELCETRRQERGGTYVDRCARYDNPM